MSNKLMCDRIMPCKSRGYGGFGLSAHITDHCNLVLKFPAGTNSTWDMIWPSLLRDLPNYVLNPLRKNGLCRARRHHLSLLLTPEQLEEASSTSPIGSYKLSYDGIAVVLLVWLTAHPTVSDHLKLASWKKAGGRVRNQLRHLLCWAYTSTDLVSAIRVIRKLDKKYIPLCPWFLCDSVNPELLDTDPDAKKGHVCYGSMTEEALRYIEKDGVPREIRDHRVFDCRKYAPSAKNKKYSIDSVRTFANLAEALDHLHIQPVGASLLTCRHLWRKSMKGNIYYGPLSPNSQVMGYHGVMIVAVEDYKGEWVALCKLSNGRKVGDGGYIRVSLRVMFMVLSAEGEDGEHIRDDPSPQHLLSNFVCPIIRKRRVKVKALCLSLH
ncbi:unnamed protein product [Eruca vesicaria subsp. sativa]|uniref:Peptidase C1A papain C-terminal domain-containing protein n=1 Tax=Eruca vesicaria subsp. sativa TaxID=29727 RepID=A0ABC8KDQ1_ERUVS|nr:unnamed protein product [Eruca vesicaria subsp. sativa]